MRTVFRLGLLLIAPVALALQSANVDAQTQGARSPSYSQTLALKKAQMNEWTVGLAGGLLEGAPICLASEIARVVDDGPNLHILPVVTRGATENLNSLLYLRGIDTAIINSDALEEYRIPMPDVRRRITYLLNLFPSELHISSAGDREAAGSLRKKVNFNTAGTAAAYSGPLIFSRLGIDVEKRPFPTRSRLSKCAKAIWLRRLHHLEAC